MRPSDKLKLFFDSGACNQEDSEGAFSRHPCVFHIPVTFDTSPFTLLINIWHLSPAYPETPFFDDNHNPVRKYPIPSPTKKRYHRTNYCIQNPMICSCKDGE